MGEIVPARSRKPNRLAWIITSFVLLMVVAVAGITLIGTHAAPAPSQLDGRYAVRATTTAGPRSGLYITGEMALGVSGTKIDGVICGLSYAPSECTSVTGTTTDNVHVTLTIAAIKSAKMPDINLTGTFQQSSGAKGSFTGFVGTFSFGKNSGHWEGIQGTVPSATGKWNIYLLIKAGNNRGQSYHGVLNLVQSSTGGKVTGTYCPTGGSCIPVKGTNTSGYIQFDFGNRAIFVLKGTFTIPDKGANGRMDGQFYMPGSGTGAQNSRGYWVAND